MKNIKTFEEFNYNEYDMIDESWVSDAYEKVKGFFKGKSYEEKVKDTLLEISRHNGKKKVYMAAVKRKDGSAEKYVEWMMNSKTANTYPRWDPIKKEWYEGGRIKSNIDYGDWN